MAKTDQSFILDNWQTLQKHLHGLTEEECWKLLAEEKKGLRRTQFLLRLYGRANKLRGKRERVDLFQ